MLEHSIDISAPPGRVWDLVSDVRRMHQWSPQVLSTRLRKGFDAVTLGAEFTNLNHQDELQWTTHAEIVAFDVEKELAFRVQENWVVWSFVLEPTPSGGTRLTQRRTAPDGISEVSREFTDSYLGGPEVFRETMRDGMRQTLERLKAEAES